MQCKGSRIREGPAVGSRARGNKGDTADGDDGDGADGGQAGRQALLQ